MMRERAQEKAESARQLKAAQQANTAMMQQIADLRAMITASSQQPGSGGASVVSRIDERQLQLPIAAPASAPVAAPASAPPATTTHASTSDESVQAKKKKRKKPPSPSPSASPSYSDSSSESSAREKRSRGKKNKGKKKRSRRSTGTPVELRQARTVLAGLYAAKSAASDDTYLRIVQQIGEVEYRIDRLLAQQR
eukprot:6191887-Pleurochrysis_carterae.AAC.1